MRCSYAPDPYFVNQTDASQPTSQTDPLMTITAGYSTSYLVGSACLSYTRTHIQDVRAIVLLLTRVHTHTHTHSGRIGLERNYIRSEEEETFVSFTEQTNTLQIEMFSSNPTYHFGETRLEKSNSLPTS